MKADSAICILLPLDLTILTSSILEKLRTKMLTATEVAASGTKERKTKISAKSYYRIHIYSLSRCCYICTYLPTNISTVGAYLDIYHLSTSSSRVSIPNSFFPKLNSYSFKNLFLHKRKTHISPLE